LIIPIDDCLLRLRAGKIVALPSETVYGLAGNALVENTLDLIYELKGRPSTNPLIVHTPGVEQARKLGKFNENAHKLADALWPGPLTMILPKKECIPDRISAGMPTVALRSPAHPLFRKVLLELDFPLAAPSANRSNHISPTCPEHIIESFAEDCPDILDGGRCPIGVESTVVSLLSAEDIRILRPGPISADEIENIIGASVHLAPTVVDREESKSEQTSQASISPGQNSTHYAPQTPLFLYGDQAALAAKLPNKDEDVVVVVHTDEQRHAWSEKGISSLSLSSNGDMAEITRNLYDTLYLADRLGKQSIHIAKTMGSHALNRTVNDRLLRASRGFVHG